MWCRALALVPGPVHGVDQQYVLPAVVVVIEKSAARAECFGQQLAAICAAVVPKMDARLLGNVRELETQRRRRSGCQCRERRRPRRNSGATRVRQEVAPLHGNVTKPLRIAYTTSSAVL